MARAIVRYSFEGKARKRTVIRERLEAADFKLIGTASYEKHGSRGELVQALIDVLAAVQSTEDSPLDHLWIYLDEPKDPDE